MIDDADDTEISSYLYKYVYTWIIRENYFWYIVSSANKDYLIFAMQDGTIRVNKVNPNDFRDLSDYWTLAMHDNQLGFVPRICFSFDERYLFTCGFDGNVFSYKFQPDMYQYKSQSNKVVREENLLSISDEDGYKKLSLEATMIKLENDRIEKLANEKKVSVEFLVFQ